MKHIAKALYSILLLTSLVFAQTTGKVTDTMDQPIHHARIIVLNQTGSIIRETFSNERGEFSILQLPSGEHFIAAEVEGMALISNQKIQLSNATRVIHLKMQVAAIKDSIIVSATRTENSLASTPASVFVISTQDLARSQHVHVLDALRSSPGVTVLQTGRRGGITSLFMRGGESDYTKVLVDGIPLNDAGGAFDLSDLTTDNAERIELVRGASSALYGSDAMSGVLQFITRHGTSSTPAFELTTEGGSYKFNRQAAKVAGANGAFDYSLSFTHLYTNGRDRNDDYQNRIGSASIGYRFNDFTNLRLIARSENSGLGVPGATERYFVDPDERARRRRFATGLRLENQTTRNWRQSWSVVYAENNQLGLDPAAQDLTKPDTPLDTSFAFNDFVSFFNNHQKRRGVRYQSDISLPGRNLLSAGIEYEKESAVFDSGFTGNNRVAPERTNTGIFVQHQFYSLSRFAVTAGVRIENNRAELPANFASVLQALGSVPFAGQIGFGTQMTPKIAAMILARQGNNALGATRLRTSFGTGIKAATLVEAFSPNSFFLGNPGLKPERARSFDVGIEQLFLRERFRIEATFFENKFRDQIAYVGDPATFGGPVKTSQGVLTSFINNDRTRSRGLELGLVIFPTRHLSINGHYTVLNSKILAAADIIDFTTSRALPNPEIGLSLLRRPKHFGAINIAWNGGRLDLQLNGLFLGSRRDIDPVTFSRLVNTGGYTKVDINSGYRITSRIMAFGRIENLLNQKYQEVLGFPSYPLNFSVGLRVRISGEK